MMNRSMIRILAITEKRMSDFLSEVRSDDMPSQALDLLILRTTGLVRFLMVPIKLLCPKMVVSSVLSEDGAFGFPSKDELENAHNDQNKTSCGEKYFEWKTLHLTRLVLYKIVYITT